MPTMAGCYGKSVPAKGLFPSLQPAITGTVRPPSLPHFLAFVLQA